MFQNGSLFQNLNYFILVIHELEVNLLLVRLSFEKQDQNQRIGWNTAMDESTHVNDACAVCAW